MTSTSCIAAISTEVTMPTSCPHPSCPSDVNICMSQVPRAHNLDHTMPHPTIFCEYKVQTFIKFETDYSDLYYRAASCWRGKKDFS